MADFSDLGNLEICAPADQGFGKLNPTKPFVGYSKAQEYFERCLPRNLGEQAHCSLIRVLGVGDGAQAEPYGCNVAFMQAMSTGSQSTIAAEWLINAKRELHFITITPADWMVDEFSPIIDLKRWRMQLARWLIRLDVTALALIEAAPFTNYPWERDGRAISFHAHIVCYKTDAKKFTAAFRSLRAQLDKDMLLNLPSIVIKPIRQIEADVRYVSGYLAKPATSAKRVTWISDDEIRLYNTALPRILGLRQAEIMSFLRPQELIVTRGSAAWEWRKSILASVGMIGLQRYPDRLPDRQLHQLWGGMKTAILQNTSSAAWRVLLDRQSPVVVRR